MLMATEIKGNLRDVFGPPATVVSLPDPVDEGMCMILVRSPMEQVARDALRRYGIGAWWPNYQREIISRDRETGKRYKRLEFSGVLPGVILSPVRFTKHFWRVIDLAPGVISVAQKPNGHWLLLNDLDIVLIHKIEHGLNRPKVAASEHKFKHGDKVVFVDDIYRRLPPGVVARCRRDGHIDVEVNMMGRSQPLTVLPDQIELA